MKKLLLALSLLALVLSESNTNAFGRGRYNNASADYPVCCNPQTVNTGCGPKCCRDRVVGRARWSCCRTARCCRQKKVCCPRYKCCKPKRSCCAQPVPVCEVQGCVTTPTTTCVEDNTFGAVPAAGYVDYGTSYNTGSACTTCTPDYSSLPNGYPTSYGDPIIS
jgi:hypothetical protein